MREKQGERDGEIDKVDLDESLWKEVFSWVIKSCLGLDSQKIVNQLDRNFFVYLQIVYCFSKTMKIDKVSVSE